jgi:hypothetical protein
MPNPNKLPVLGAESEGAEFIDENGGGPGCGQEILY